MEFRRLDQGMRIARGLGLGLSIVERVARVIGSTVAMDSVPGRGSHFAVTVPVSNAAPVEMPAREDARVDPGQLAGTVALCIDNEPSVLEGMETLLRGWGCDVIKAPDLELALRAIASGVAMPNGLLVDYHLDHGNGIDAILTLRRHCGDIPAILITADRSPAVREQVRAEGIQLLNKPVKPAALRALLAQWRIHRAAAE
jgi:CheY-like chemotaxis protein